MLLRFQLFVLFINFINANQFSLKDRSIAKSPPGILSDGIGLGARGVLHYFLDLVEGCDNVKDLNKWVASLEAYLSCEDASWPTKAEEIQQASELRQIQYFCKAWPARLKCTNLLSHELDSCYKYDESLSSERRRIGSDAAIMSDTFARQICQNKNYYLEIVEKNESSTPADERSLNCFIQGRTEILECIWQRNSLSPQRSNVCSHIEKAKECFPSGYFTPHCKRTFDWINETIAKISTNLKC